MLNEDFKDILLCLLEEKVEFLLIGAYALAAHGFPRATKDIDLWVKAGGQNAPRVFKALHRFGAPMSQVEVKDFETPGAVLQIGVAPRRIDITTKIDGVDFDDAFEARNEIEIDGLKIPILSRRHLIANKKASGRPQDLVDVQALEKAGD